MKVYRKRLGWFLAGAVWLLLMEGVCALAVSGALIDEPPLPMVVFLIGPLILVATWE